MELPADERVGVSITDAFLCGTLAVAGTGKRAGWDTKASFCECSEEYGRIGEIAGSCWGAWQHRPFAFIADESQAVTIPRQHACCAIGCMARKQADAGIAIHRTTIASISNAPFLPLPTCIV